MKIISFPNAQVTDRIDIFRENFKQKTGKKLSRPKAVEIAFSNDNNFKLLMEAEYKQKRRRKNEFMVKI